MLEQELKKEEAQEAPESEGVVRQSAAEYLKERIGDTKCIITLPYIGKTEENMQNHGCR